MNGVCGGFEPIVRIIKNGILRIVCILVPIFLILFGIIDLGKAVIASDEKEVKAAQSRLIKRVIYGIVIFLVPSLVSMIMGLVAQAGASDTDSTSWAACWDSI